MDGESNEVSRAKRQKIDKTGRLEALKKLRNLKGQKHKYDLEQNVDNVYDVVDENEFVKRARNMFDMDWIEDDGTGYLEDGRDFFEDADDYSDGNENTSKNSKDSKKRKRKKDSNTPNISGKNKIYSMLTKGNLKKRETNTKLDDDEILSDILIEIKPKSCESITQQPNALTATKNQSLKNVKNKSDETIVKEYMENFIKGLKTKENKSNENDLDNKILEKIELSEKQEILKLNCEKDKKKDEELKVVERNEIENDRKIKENVSKEVEEKNKDEDLNNKKNDIDESNLLDDNMLDDILENEIFDDIIEDEILEKIVEDKISTVETKNVSESVKPTTSSSSSSTTKPTTNTFLDGTTKEVKIWFWDAWEDTQKFPGQCWIFGRIQNGMEYKSICVHIENVDRVLYVLPREYMLDPITKEKTKQAVTFKDMYNEFRDDIGKALNITTFSCEKVVKNFAFNLPGINIPESCEYLKIQYEGKKGIPNMRKKYNTIAHIFGTNTSAIETFLLECKIKGPSWLNIKNFRIKDNSSSWCKSEIGCSSLSCISVAEERSNSPPPIVFIGLNIKTALHPKTLKNEIVMISCLVNDKFSIDKPSPNRPVNKVLCGITRPSTQNWPVNLTGKLQNQKFVKIMKLDSEQALLNWFLATYQTIDPDMIVTFDAHDCQLDAIIDRISTLKIAMWSRLGKLKISRITSRKFKDFFAGRMICDVKQSAEELIKSRSYDLDTLCTNVLKLKENERCDISNDDLYSMYENENGLLKLITCTVQDCLYIIRIMCELNVLPLALQITSICGNLMSRTLQGGRSERNEFLLLHAFNEKNYIVPDKKMKEIDLIDSLQTGAEGGNIGGGGGGRKKAAYSGGLVLEPQKGFYDKFILLMDFNSLYPSIIQEYNICFTTITATEDANETPLLPDPNAEQGILPRQIRRLVESRREVKKLMANPDLEPEQKIQYNIRQLALKLTANSMYGCLGFQHSRFFAQHLAALVTQKGREILMNTKGLVQKMNYSVIYGDTDSIMINTNCIDYEQVFRIGLNIKQTVNKVYKQIELDVDGIFKYLLLLKKKKYAAVLITKNKIGEFCYTQEHKGLDIVRRDWSQISVMAGKIILDEILSDKQLDEKIENIQNHLEKFKENITNGTVPLPLLTITKQLTKPPKDYTVVNTLPHVQVALRMNSERNKRYKKGDMVSYIICEDETDNPPMQRAYHLDELKSNPKLKVDNTYYLSQQIHPVISRLCEPLEGIDAAQIATCLGLDPTKFKVNTNKSEKDKIREGDGIQVLKTSIQRFRQCEKFQFTCIHCKTVNIVASAFKPLDKNYVGVLEKCVNNECTGYPYQYVTSIRNELILSVRKCIRRFYQNWMVCDDPTCNKNTRNYYQLTTKTKLICPRCIYGKLIRQYSETDLYNQLDYYRYMFDLSQHEKKNINFSLEIQTAYNLLKETIDQILEKSEYRIIRLTKLFSHYNVLLKSK